MNEATTSRLKETVAALGISFLKETRSAYREQLFPAPHLNALINGAPWTRSFIFGRALQNQALKRWKENPSNVAITQTTMLHCVRYNSLAVQGKNTAAIEPEGSLSFSAK